MFFTSWGQTTPGGFLSPKRQTLLKRRRTRFPGGPKSFVFFSGWPISVNDTDFRDCRCFENVALRASTGGFFFVLNQILGPHHISPLYTFDDFAWSSKPPKAAIFVYFKELAQEKPRKLLKNNFFFCKWAFLKDLLGIFC